MKLLATTATALLLASQAFAGSYQEKCFTKNVPHQTTSKGDPGAVIGGVVVGGVVGKVVTKTDGGAVVGAVVGGVVANEASKKKVTKNQAVTSCRTVFVPERIADEDLLRANLQDLSDGRPVSRETTMDVQYTIGVTPDGSWGPRSQAAADEYLANFQPNAPIYSLVVNDVIIMTSDEIAELDLMKQNLMAAGVEATIIVDLQ